MSIFHNRLPVFEDEIARFKGGLGAVETAQFEAKEAAAGKGLRMTPGIGVTEAPFVFLVVFQDIGDRFFDRFIRNRSAV